jgi:hypothetical protein
MFIFTRHRPIFLSRFIGQIIFTGQCADYFYAASCKTRRCFLRTAQIIFTGRSADDSHAGATSCRLFFYVASHRLFSRNSKQIICMQTAQIIFKQQRTGFTLSRPHFGIHRHHADHFYFVIRRSSATAGRRMEAGRKYIYIYIPYPTPPPNAAPVFSSRDHFFCLYSNSTSAYILLTYFLIIFYLHLSSFLFNIFSLFPFLHISPSNRHWLILLYNIYIYIYI